MRRTHRYTVRFPDAVFPPASLYREQFAAFPFWYRFYLRLRALFGGATVERAAKAHHLAELRRRLERIARGIVDCSVPALLPAFHSRVRSLDAHVKRVRGALDETTGVARGTFLCRMLDQVAPELTETLHHAAELPETDRDDPFLALEEAQQRALQRMTRAVEDHVQEIERALAPRWTALRTLNLLQRVDLDALLPVQGARREQTPLRVVRDVLQQLHQTLELCHRHADTVATEQAWNFAARRIRSKPGPPRAIWSEIEEFRAAVPLFDLIRYAADEPFLELPSLTIKSDWWTPFKEEWCRWGVEEVAPQLIAAREAEIERIVTGTFLIDRSVPSWIPSQLYPRTVGPLLLLASADLFHDTRRVVTQLVIDAEFTHLDTRNALHQAALQVDQALERLRALLGDGRERGSLGDEIQRLQQRSSASSLVRRQLTGLYERYRPRVRSSVEEVIQALESAGTVVAKTEVEGERAYTLRDLHGHGFSGEHQPADLLRIVADWWLPLGRHLRGLFRLEQATSGRWPSRDLGTRDAVQ